MSAGRSESGSMPAWLISVTRRGEPDASTSFGRPIIAFQSSAAKWEEGALAESDPLHNRSGIASSYTRHRRREARLDAFDALVAHRAVGVEPLLAVALDRARVGGRPVFDRGRQAVGQLDRLVVRLRGERDDEIVGEALLEVFQLLEGHRLMVGDVNADLVHGGDR